MNFENLKKNQEYVVKLIDNSFKEKRLVHLYLFSGSKEALKLDAAFYLANLLLCENGNACGKCDECKKLSKFANPNLYMISPDGDTIKKEQIEDLEHEFGFAKDHPHVFIIQNIEKATLTAANTLLKFLEELHEDCYGILLTDKIEAVIPTIISRSQVVRFLPIQHTSIRDDLVKRKVSEEKANIIANLTSDINKAFELAKDTKIDYLIDLAVKVGFEFENSNGFLEFTKNKKDFEKLDKTYCIYFIEMLMMIQKDKINKLLYRNKDFIFEESIEMCNILRSKEDEVKILEVLLKYRDRLESNASVDMTFTGMFISLDF